MHTNTSNPMSIMFPFIIYLTTPCTLSIFQPCHISITNGIPFSASKIRKINYKKKKKRDRCFLIVNLTYLLIACSCYLLDYKFFVCSIHFLANLNYAGLVDLDHRYVGSLPNGRYNPTFIFS